VLNYDELIKHEQKCPCQDTVCSGCGKVFIAKEAVEHEKVCDDIVVTCNGCQLVLKRNIVAAHEQDKIACMEAKMENICKIYEEKLLIVTNDNQKLKETVDAQQAEIATLKSQQIPNKPQKEGLKNSVNGKPIPVCNNNHQLRFYPAKKRFYPSTSFGCEGCGVSSEKASLHCPLCNFDLCQACSPFPYNKVMCPNRHVLAKSFRSYNCEKCGKGSLGNSYCCKLCDFDLCGTCHNSL